MTSIVKKILDLTYPTTSMFKGKAILDIISSNEILIFCFQLMTSIVKKILDLTYPSTSMFTGKTKVFKLFWTYSVLCVFCSVFKFCDIV